MHLTSFILLGCALTCPIGMGAMMWFMSKGAGGNRRGRSASPERDRESDG